MQTSDSFADQITPSEPFEIDPAMWSEIAGGSPKNTWASVQRLFGSAPELALAEG